MQGKAQGTVSFQKDPICHDADEVLGAPASVAGLTPAYGSKHGWPMGASYIQEAPKVVCTFFCASKYACPSGKEIHSFHEIPRGSMT